MVTAHECDPLLSNADLDVTSHSKNGRTLSRYVLVSAVFVLGITITVPSRPELILAASGYDASFAAICTAVIESIRSLFAAFSSPALGAIADTSGRVPVIIFGFALNSLGLVVIAVARLSLPGQFLGYLMTSVSDSVTPVILAAIADIAKDRESATKAFAQFSAAQGAAITLGPLCGAIIVLYSFTAAPLLVAALIFAVSIPFVYQLTDTRSVRSLEPFSFQTVSRTTHTQVRECLLETQVLALLSLASIVTSLATSGLFAIAYLYFSSVVNWNSTQFGLLGSVTGLAIILSQLFLATRMERILGVKWLIVFGHICYASHSLMFATVVNVEREWLIWAGILISVPYFASLPSTKAVIARQIDADRQGLVQGSLAAVVSLLKPVSTIGLAAVFAVCNAHGAPGAVFFPIASLSLIAAVVSYMALSHVDLK